MPKASPAVHHPDPNRFALRKFAESRSSELFPPYDLPGTQLFQDLCVDVISRWDLENRVIPLGVTRIEPVANNFRLWLQDGQSIVARRVVLAIGNANLQIPNWVEKIESEYPQDKLCHSSKVDLRGLQLAGEKIAIAISIGKVIKQPNLLTCLFIAGFGVIFGALLGVPQDHPQVAIACASAGTRVKTVGWVIFQCLMQPNMNNEKCGKCNP